MARVTVEDCLLNVDNHFAMARIAAKRARQLARGADAHVPWNDHKSTVLALQEIAAGHVHADVLDEADLPAISMPKLELEQLETDGFR